jgi:beta-lactamase regulating signal transducer with metallopeptidase domain
MLAVACSLPGWPRVRLVTTVYEQFDPAPPSMLEEQQVVASTTIVVPETARSRKSVEDVASPAKDHPSGIPQTVPLNALTTQAFPVGSATVTTLQQLGTTVFYGFTVGFVCVALWLLWGAIQAVLLARKATVAPTHLQTELSRIVGAGRGCPRLFLSAEIAYAVAMGIRRPTIILPAHFAEKQSHGSVRALLAHEWAHIQNKDLWMLGVNRCLLLLLFAHPLYWWLRARIREDQELLADASAANQTKREEYAAQLLAWARTRAGKSASRVPAAVGVWERPSALSRRIETLLDDSLRIETDCSRLWRRSAVVMLMLFTVLLSCITFRPESLALYAAAQAPEKESGEEPSQKDPSDTTKDLKTPTVLEALNSPTEFNFIGTPLTEAINFLAEHHRIPIVIDKLALEDEGISTDVEVNFTISGVTLRSALSLIHEPLGLSWEIIADDGIKITTAEYRAPDPMFAAVYPLDAVVKSLFGEEDAQKPKAEFRQVILASIDPTSWNNAGGRGIAAWGQQGFVVYNTRSVHEQMRNLKWFLNQSDRESLDLKYTPIRARIEAALNAQVEVNFIDQPLIDVIFFTQDVHNINICLDEPAIEEEGVSRDHPVDYVSDKFSLSQALDQILEPLGLDYVIQHEVLRITSRQTADALLEFRIYNLKQLVGENVMHDTVMREVVDSHVRGCVNAKSWAEGGGRGTIAYLPGYLLVYQTQRAHREIPRRLKQLMLELDGKQEPPVNKNAAEGQ